MDNLNTITNYKLPNGCIYTGQCRSNPPFIELKGLGELHYPNGELYKGQFNYGRPYGIGNLYFNEFNRKEFHYGVFDDKPNGIGYLKLQIGEYIGFFSDGLIYGWGINIYKGKILFGWWENGKLQQNLSSEIAWIIKKIHVRLKFGYHGETFTVTTKNQVSFFYGVAPQYDTIFDLESSGVGIRFCNDGSVIVGEEAYYNKVGYMITGDVDVYLNSPRDIIKGQRWERGIPVSYRPDFRN